ncbi:hypothetical protein Maq22A_1p36050 (plasmid) [Methylobacterium aquaticum]|uniref:Uncharacterized protein n=1 Tax=Methylobacterium aquaticum TaxID=270351 RepID=A0A0C6FQT4_9HYPH|nr:hypothetical protein Maq22A_1p36050 [Methylobacterium aquaticum]
MEMLFAGVGHGAKLPRQPRLDLRRRFDPLRQRASARRETRISRREAGRTFGMRSPVDSVSSASTPRSPPTASPTGGVITTTSVVSTVNAVVLALPEMRGKRGELLRAVAALAAAGEINVEFRLALPGHSKVRG